MKFGDILLPDGLIRGPFGSDMKKSLFVNDAIDNVKVITQENVFSEDQNIGVYFITPDYFNKMKRFEVQSKDFLITCDGTLGKIAFIDNLSRKSVINSSLLIIRVNKNKVDYSFFYYYWKNYLGDAITKRNVNSCLKHLPSLDVIKNEIIDIPNMEEQRKIGHFLSSLDSKIKINNEISNVLISKIKDGYSFYSRQYNVTPDNLRNDNFHSKESLEIKSLFSFEKGKEPSADNVVSKGAIKYYRVRDIDGDSFSTICDNCELTIAKYGDIVYSLDGTIGKISYQVDGAISSGLYIVRPKLIDKNVFTYCVMSDESIIKKLQYGSRSNTIIKHASSLLSDLCIEISINGSLYFSEIFNKAFLMCVALAKENIKIESQKMFYACLMLCGVLRISN